jgi:hypothetical protein
MVEDVPHVRRCRHADLLGGDDFDVVEPQIGIESALFRLRVARA